MKNEERVLFKPALSTPEDRKKASLRINQVVNGVGILIFGGLGTVSVSLLESESYIKEITGGAGIVVCIGLTVWQIIKSVK